MRPDVAEVGAEAAGRTLGFDRLQGSAQRANDFAVSGLQGMPSRFLVRTKPKPPSCKT